MKTYEIKATSFEGRLPIQHEFTMSGESEEDIRQAIKIRWPQMYNIVIKEIS